MDNNNPPTFLQKLLARTGGFYIVIVLALAQLIVTPLGIALAALILMFNSEYAPSQIASLAFFTGGGLLIRNVLLLIGAYFVNKELVTSLTMWKMGQRPEPDSELEKRAWRQATLISWRYIAIAFTALMTLIVTPVLIYARLVVDATQDQIFYTLIAIIVAGICLPLLEVFVIERMMIPARNVLVPAFFTTQLKGVRGTRMRGKFVIVMVAIIIVSVLLIAPIGYHQTFTVLYREVGSQEILTTLQFQSLVAAIFAIAVGIGISFLLARSISQPVNDLITVFQKVEEGDLSQRVKVTATDEVGELAVHFNRMAFRLEELQTSLEQRVTERTEQLRATIEVGQVASSILDADDLISRVVNLITTRFGYYYSAIFLIDSTGHWAELKDATGIAGHTLKNQGHRLEIGGKSMVSSSISRRVARIALDVGAEPIRFENPLLPETRSEIALPLMVGDRVIGAMDVQSTKEAAFDQENIITLQGMANQVAIALENARLFQETQKSLEELKAAHRIYISNTWAGMSNPKSQYEYQSSDSSETPDQPSMEIEVPITLRDQVIGSLKLEGRQEFSQDERNLIEAVATQAALALENARLLEESQQSALRERLISEITNKIWASPNIDTILQTGIKELGRALRADEATIELQ